MLFRVKENDILPSIQHTMTDWEGNAVDLTGYVSILFYWKRQDGVQIGGADFSSAAATVVDAAAGLVEYSFQGSQTFFPGAYYSEFVVTLPGGERTSPVQGFLEFIIEEDIRP